MWISTKRTFLPFKIPITDHGLQVAKSSFFTFIFSEYREWGKNETLYYAIHVFPLAWRIQLSVTESVYVTCMAAICYQFLPSGCASYHFSIHVCQTEQGIAECNCQCKWGASLSKISHVQPAEKKEYSCLCPPVYDRVHSITMWGLCFF